MTINKNIISDYTEAVKLLDELLSVAVVYSDREDIFEDSDGLIRFVGLSSDKIIGTQEYKIGREICDKISNFYCTLRDNTYALLLKNPSKLLPNDSHPKNKWSPSVTNYMNSLLQKAGGFTNFKHIETNYSHEQYLHKFSEDFIKILFDSVTAPSAIIQPVTDFLKRTGDTLRASWDKESKYYSIIILSQCHESIDVNGKIVYYPKIKYYYVLVNTEQKEFTTPCSNTKKIKFNFRYSEFVTGINQSLLNNNNNDFISFLNKAQSISYNQASDELDEILNVNSKNSDV
ncbi:hypothetical protein [Xenorhabdus bovienii]|uniref:hypothetical protein n=1 Tax=Xenorhabdus bovienii TaxID=40576 RepID=UPI0023B20CD6|nr:hypothetical protein [Xenorhabdus bovienii]MDE9484305.1 hypothetical protein [Xenorhabdus bovienii]